MNARWFCPDCDSEQWGGSFPADEEESACCPACESLRLMQADFRRLVDAHQQGQDTNPELMPVIVDHFLKLLARELERRRGLRSEREAKNTVSRRGPAARSERVPVDITLDGKAIAEAVTNTPAWPPLKRQDRILRLEKQIRDLGQEPVQ